MLQVKLFLARFFENFLFMQELARLIFLTLGKKRSRKAERDLSYVVGAPTDEKRSSTSYPIARKN